MLNTLKNIVQLTAVYSLITISGLLILLLRISSLGLLTDVNRKYIFPPFCRLMLSIVGIKVRLPLLTVKRHEKLLITFNHNSYLDVLILASMGLTNTKFIISEKTLKLVPVTLAVLGIGGIYIPMQEKTERRLRFFRKLAEKINRKKFSIAASSEGVHNHHHGIDRFNRGIYHLATVCNMKIITLFISIPEESNPFSKYRYFKRGTVTVELLEPINTETWKVEDLDRNKDHVRALYVKKFNETHQANIV